MRVVHHEVASLELQRVDDVAAATGQPLDLPRVVAGGATEELALAEKRQLRLRKLEARVDGCLQQVRDAGLGIRGQGLHHAAG